MEKIRQYMIDIIESKKDLLTEAFSEVYGNEYHDIIKKKINDTKVEVYYEMMEMYKLNDLRYHIKLHDNEKATQALIDLEEYRKKRYFLDHFNEYAYKEIQTIYPEYTNDKFPLSIANQFMAFFERLGKDKFKNRNILNRRVLFYKSMGINLGDDYSLYENHPECKKIKPNKEMKEKFEVLIKKIYSVYGELEDLFAEKGNYEQIKQNLINDGYEFNELPVKYQFLNGKNISYHFLARKDGKLSSVCVFNMQELLSMSEQVYVHEFSHALGSVVGKGKHKILNEAIEQSLILEVYNYILDKGETFFTKNPEKTDYSSYDIIVPIGKAFVEKFKEDISRLRFTNEKNLNDLIDEKFLDKINLICEEVLEEYITPKIDGSSHKFYINALVQTAVNEIKKYNNKQR